MGHKPQLQAGSRPKAWNSTHRHRRIDIASSTARPAWRNLAGQWINAHDSLASPLETWEASGAEGQGLHHTLRGARGLCQSSDRQIRPMDAISVRGKWIRNTESPPFVSASAKNPRSGSFTRCLGFCGCCGVPPFEPAAKTHRSPLPPLTDLLCSTADALGRYISVAELATRGGFNAACKQRKRRERVLSRAWRATKVCPELQSGHVAG